MHTAHFMDRARTFLFPALIVCLFLAPRLSAAGEKLRREWKVEGITREGLLYVPAKDRGTNAAPVVFAFHGHGGSMRNAARSFHIETLWPEAIVVYLQGLNTPGRLTDPEGKLPGWQKTLGDQGDRDLKCFDVVLESLSREYQVDTNRIFATGHSNGGAFTYLLMQARGERIAAFAPSAALHRELFSSKPDHVGEAEPVLHIAGEKDTLVKFEWQELFLQQLRKRRQCAIGIPWSHDRRCTLYSSANNAGNIITYIHPGTHKFPEEAPELIVQFFKNPKDSK